MKKRLTNNYYLCAFMASLCCGILAFIYFILKGEGLFTLSNDFNAQEISFNMLANNAIKSGEVLWNWNIDIGSSFVETFSFYNLGSPFFWISLVFPAKAFPFLIGWIYILKYAIAGVTSYAYIQRFVKDKRFAVLGSMLYAFSGFQSCNLVFYHFHDVVALFPLLLLGVEVMVEDDKKGVFALAVFINALLNYFFFVGEVIFVIIYFVIRFLLTDVKQVKKIVNAIIEGILGVGMAAVLFVPSIMSILNNPRTSQHLWGANALAFGTRDYLQILKALFFPAEIMSSQSTVFQENWYSVAAYLPMVGILFVIAYMAKQKKDWLTRMLYICLVMALIPVLNNIFVMFTPEVYRRWYYMPILLMALSTSKVLENREKYSLKKPFVGVMLSIGVIYCFIRFFPWSETVPNLIYRKELFNLITVIGGSGCIISMLIYKSKPKRYFHLLTFGISIFCIGTTALNIHLYRFNSQNSAQTVYNDVVVTGQDLEQDILPYRYGFWNTYVNRSMAAYVPSRSSFCSTVSPGIFEFYDALGVGRHTESPQGPEGTNELLSAKYFITGDFWEGRTPEAQYTNGNQTINVYVDDNTLPIGFTYNTYMTKSEFLQLDSSLRALAMLKTLVIDDADENQVKEVLRHYDAGIDGAIEIGSKEVDINKHSIEASEKFDVTSGGFSSVITTDKEKYAFFSVPYSENWQASVNANKVSIININGLIAVRVEEGTNDILFEYIPKELYVGIALSIISFVIWGIWMFTVHHKKEREVIHK
ncbi:YfhO family protein [Murimonas intestini]|uniref:Membrane protein YfhO n=1 Tax=Murimonas intestini TaxID=1337051 RepID=A0AB73T928_9FIRM|nr:YfhO family protein [Murimonas intestini]MCR1839480.1 YfhO family protein [Murimonas intestini]MCR1864775.1 YfhO family protein [Murimonas intestini]MCR1882385.1 YfhO family protein [Murimonas intestini]